MTESPTSTELEALLEFDFATAIGALDHHVVHRPDRQAVVYGETGRFLPTVSSAISPTKLLATLQPKAWCLAIESAF